MGRVRFPKPTIAVTNRWSCFGRDMQRHAINSTLALNIVALAVSGRLVSNAEKVGRAAV